MRYMYFFWIIISHGFVQLPLTNTYLRNKSYYARNSRYICSLKMVHPANAYLVSQVSGFGPCMQSQRSECTEHQHDADEDIDKQCTAAEIRPLAWP